MDYYLLKMECDSKQLRCHTVKTEELPASNPEQMFIRYLHKEKREMLVRKVKESYYQGKSVREIARENNIKRKDVQRILRFIRVQHS